MGEDKDQLLQVLTHTDRRAHTSEHILADKSPLLHRAQAGTGLSDVNCWTAGSGASVVVLGSPCAHVLRLFALPHTAKHKGIRDPPSVPLTAGGTV